MLDKSWDKYFSENIVPAIDHAQQQRFIQTNEFKAIARYRNGVETIPAVLRKRHQVDKMPVRGLIKCILFWIQNS